MKLSVLFCKITHFLFFFLAREIIFPGQEK